MKKNAIPKDSVSTEDWVFSWDGLLEFIELCYDELIYNTELTEIPRCPHCFNPVFSGENVEHLEFDSYKCLVCDGKFEIKTKRVEKYTTKKEL